jgi:predicted site-specific integrase-resolvase
MGLDTYVRPAQAARIAGVSRQLVRRWTQLGHLTAHNGRLKVRDVLEVEAKTRAVSGRPVRSELLAA